MKKITTIANALLQGISNAEDLAALLRIPERKLNFAIKYTPDLYREIRLEKPDGTYRIINAPSDELKEIQRSILDTILIWEPIPRCAYGFGKGRTIVDNARIHSKNPYLLTCDLEDFFPSVHVSRVRRLFIKLGASESVAEILTGLTTLNHCLPQGAPTSPYLANLALKNLDVRLMRLCASNRATYSRYFNDITVSGNRRVHKMRESLFSIIEQEGYSVHRSPKKLRLYGPREEKLVTGILIRNRNLCVPNIQEISDNIRLLQNNGASAFKEEVPLKEQMSLRGKIAFVLQVNHAIGLQLKKEFEKIIWT